MGGSKCLKNDNMRPDEEIAPMPPPQENANGFFQVD